MLEVLRPPLEPEQYTSIRFGEPRAALGTVPSIGSVGASLENAMEETVNGLSIDEMVRNRGPSRDVNQLELPPSDGCMAQRNPASQLTRGHSLVEVEAAITVGSLPAGRWETNKPRLDHTLGDLPGSMSGF